MTLCHWPLEPCDQCASFRDGKTESEKTGTRSVILQNTPARRGWYQAVPQENERPQGPWAFGCPAAERGGSSLGLCTFTSLQVKAAQAGTGEGLDNLPDSEVGTARAACPMPAPLELPARAAPGPPSHTAPTTLWALCARLPLSQSSPRDPRAEQHVMLTALPRLHWAAAQVSRCLPPCMPEHLQPVGGDPFTPPRLL